MYFLRKIIYINFRLATDDDFNRDDFNLPAENHTTIQLLDCARLDHRSCQGAPIGRLGLGVNIGTLTLPAFLPSMLQHPANFKNCPKEFAIDQLCSQISS